MDLRPTQHDEGEAANLFAKRLSALGFGEVFAIGREPGTANAATLGNRGGINVENVLAMVDGLRVVYPVHAQRKPVVIDGMINVATKGELYSSRGAAASREIVHEDFVADVENELRADHKISTIAV